MLPLYSTVNGAGIDGVEVIRKSIPLGWAKESSSTQGIFVKWLPLVSSFTSQSIMVTYSVHSVTENEKLSWCRLCLHWWHCRLLLWQPLVLPLMTKLASWELLVYNAIASMNINSVIINPIHAESFWRNKYKMKHAFFWPLYFLITLCLLYDVIQNGWWEILLYFQC